MQKRLDPENLGIILLNAFMDEFFPLERRSTPDTFELMHYNGIPGSNDNNKVRPTYELSLLGIPYALSKVNMEKSRKLARVVTKSPLCISGTCMH